MRISNSRLASMAFAALLSTTVVAQSNHVAWSKIETGAWVMHPIYTQSAGGATSVSNFLALADPTVATGDNLIGVWYHREATCWTTKSWTTDDPWTIINAVKEELDLPDNEDERWNVGGSGSTESEEPQDYSSGVLAADPLAALVSGAPDRNALIELLTMAGYQAADLPIDKDDTCTTDAKLDTLATEAMGMIAAGDDAVLSLAADAVSCDVLAGIPKGPQPVRPIPPATPPAWSPPGTVPATPGWTPGGWPIGPAWSCRTVPLPGGGSNCICSRIQRWGRWESRTCRFLLWTWTCTRWHEIWETETCTDVGGACPPAGPPAPQSECHSTY